MSKRYRATRAVWVTLTGGDTRLIREGEVIAADTVPAGLVAALVADGLIVVTRATPKE